MPEVVQTILDANINISQNNSVVNRNYAQNLENNTNSVDEGKNSFGDEDEQYLQAVQNGDTETAQKLFDATTKRAGYDIIDFKPNKFKIKKRIHQEFGESRTPRNDVSSDINISQNNIVVNRNYAQNLKNNTNSVDEDKYSFGDEDEQYLQAVTNLAA